MSVAGWAASRRPPSIPSSGCTTQTSIACGWCGEPGSTNVAVRPPSGPAVTGLVPGGPARRVHLNVENITGSGDPTSYRVYLNVPTGANAEDHPDLFAGLLPMFGVAEASKADAGH